MIVTLTINPALDKSTSVDKNLVKSKGDFSNTAPETSKVITPEYASNYEVNNRT